MTLRSRTLATVRLNPEEMSDGGHQLAAVRLVGEPSDRSQKEPS